MNDISKRSPSRDVGWSMFDEGFDNLFEGFFRPMRVTTPFSSGEHLTPAIDVTENDQVYSIKAELPGIKKEDIQITVQDGVLTISAESRADTVNKEGERVIRRERRYGKYSRSMTLNKQIDEGNVKATYNDGILELILPKKEEIKPQKINVQVG
jgi:HSP20 family protein